MVWLVSAKEIRFFTALRVYFSIYVRGFLGVKENQVSYGRIHKKTPSSNPLAGVFASTYPDSYQGAINLSRSHQPSEAVSGGLHHQTILIILKKICQGLQKTSCVEKIK
jgi:hypothetical protein